MSSAIGDRPASGPELEGGDDRRRLIVAAVAGLVAIVAVAVPAIVVLVGRTSSASFADAEVLSANRLGAAILDIEIVATPDGAGGDQGGQGADPGPQPPGEALFSATNLAPGDAVSGQLEMTNVGDVPLRYGLLASSDGGLLDRWLRFEAWVGDGRCSPDRPGPRVVEDVRIGSEPVPLVELFGADGTNVLGPGESILWCVGATLPLETPNEAQGRSLDVTLTVPAEQVPEGS